MKKIIYLFLFSFIFCLSACSHSYAQQINAIQARCPSPSLLASSVRALNTGDIAYTPCAGFASIFYGNVDFTNATITGVVTGSGTTNFVPRFTSASVIGNTPFSWDSTSYVWQNTALNSQFAMDLTPSASVGRFRVGDCITTITNCFDINHNTNTVSLVASSSINASITNSTSGIELAGESAIGDVNNTGNQTKLSINDGTEFFTFSSVDSLGRFVLTDINNFQFQRTITPSGTTGGVTIDKPLGAVNVAAAATSITVIDSVANDDSLIFCTIQTLDTTAKSCFISSKGNGFFEITLNAAATAETRVAFWVTN